MARQAIRNEGAPAEQAFLAIVAMARASDSAKRGDAIVSRDGIDHYIEIKHTTSNTINQIRAVKFIPLVIYSPQEPLPWAVIPAHEVVRLVVEKERGQHTELALESANLSLSGISASFRCGDAGLSQAVHGAIGAASAYQELREVLTELLQNLSEMKEQFREKVRAALAAGDKR